MQLKSIGRLSLAEEMIGKASNIDEIADAVKTLTLSETAELLVKKDINTEDAISIIRKTGVSKASALQALESAKVTAAETAETGATVGLSTAFKGLWASITPILANPLTWVAVATAAFIGLGYAIDSTVDSMDDIQKRLDENKEELESYKTKLDELKSKLEEIRDIDALGLSEDEKKSLETTKQNIEDQIELYDLLKKAKEQAVNEDSAKLATGNTYEVRPIEALKKLKSGDLKGALSEGVETSKDMIKNPLNWLLPGSATLFSLMPKETDNYLEQLDKQKNQYEKIVDEFNDANERLKLDAFNETYLKELEDVKIDKSNKLAEIADTLEHVQEIREQLVNADDGKDYTEQIEKLDEYISEYQGFLTRELDFNLNEASEQIEEVKEKVEELTYIDFSDITTQVTNFTAAQESLNSALSEQVSNGTITEDTLASLKEQYEGIENAIEFTTDGIILNTEKLRDLNAEQRQNIADELSQKEEELAKQYNDETRKLAALNEAKRLNIGVTDDEISAQQNIIDKLDSQIADLKILQKEYQNSISTHNAFMEALSSSNEGAGYESIVSSLEKVQEQWDKGLVGTDDIRTFVDYMTSTDMSNASIDEITSQFENAMSMAKEFFTEGSEGSQKFLDLLADTTVEVDGVTKALAEYNTATDTWDINIDDMAQASEATGYSVDFLIDNLNRLKDYGFSVEFGETDDFINYQQAISNVNDEISETQALLDKSGGKSKELKNKLEALNQIKVNLRDNLSLDIFDEAVKKVQELQTQISHLESIGAPTQAIEAKKQQQGQVAQSVGMTVQEVLDVDTSSADSIMEAWKKKAEESDPTVKVDADISQAESAINSVANKTYSSDLILNLKTTGQDTVKQTLNNIFNKAKGNDSSGKASALGTAQFGKSFVDGKIGYTGNQRNVMVGEVAPEMVVDPYNASYTIYSQPTMLKKLPRNAIVFNGTQTSDILKHGTTPNFGKAFANGTQTGFAYSTSNATGKGKITKSKDSSTTTGGSTDKTKGKDNTDKTNKKTKQLVDWIERRINVLTTKAERWSNIIEKATDPSRVDSYYKKLDSVTQKQVKTYGDAYNRYMSKANTVKLSQGLKNKVQSKDSALFDKNGNLKSQKELIKKYGEKTYNRIQDYQNWYDKAISAIDEFTESSYKLANSPLEKAADKIDLLSKSLDELTATADNISIDNYKNANKNLAEQTAIAEKQRNASREALKTTSEYLSTTTKAVTGAKNLQKNDIAGKDKKERDANIKTIKDAMVSGQEVDLSLYKLGSSGYKAAVKYNAALKANIDATHEAKLAEEEYIKTDRENRKQQFDNIEQYYNKQVELTQMREDSVAREANLVEAKGMTVNKKYYEDQIYYEGKKKEKLQESKKELEGQLKLIPAGTSEWYDANKALDDVKASIDDCTKSSVEFGNQITAIADKLHDLVRGELDRIAESINVVAKTWEKYDMFSDETGMFTKEGKATLGSYVTSMHTAIAKQQKDLQVLNELKEEYSKRPDNWQSNEGIKIDDRWYYSKEQLYNAMVQYTDYYNSDFQQALENENNIIDTIIQKYEKEAEVLKRVIDEKAKSLQADKDLYEYSKNIQNATKDIGLLQKQIGALQGDDSEEGLMRRQKLQSQLDDARQDLQDQEREKYISDMEDMLNTMYDHYESELQKEMKNRDDLLVKGLENVNNNIGTITKTINDYSEKHDYKDVLDNVKEGIKGMISYLSPDLGVKANVTNQYKLPENLLTTVETKLQGIIEAMPKSSDSTGGDSSHSQSISTDGNEHSQSMSAGTNDGVSVSNPPDEHITENSLGKITDPLTLGLNGLKTDLLTQTSTALNNAPSKSDVTNWIKKKAQKPDKKKSEYSDTNKKIWNLTSGKVLSSDNMKALAKYVGVTYDNAKSSGKLYKALKKIGVKGFDQGGIGKLIPAGEDGLAFVRNGEGFVAPEDVKHIQELLNVVPDVKNILQPMAIPNLSSNIANNSAPIEATYNFTLENCTNARDIIRSIQTDRNVQQALQEVTVNQINGSGSRLSVNKYR